LANILVHIELRDRAVTPASLSVLNMARRIASELGATVHALLPCVEPPSYDSDDTIATLSRHGADKVALITGPSLVEPALYATHGDAIAAACAQIKPRMVAFAASPQSDELAPRLATQLGANYFPNVRIEPAEGEYLLVCEAFRRQFRVKNPLRAAGRVVVATAIPTAPPRVLGEDDAEVVVIHAPSQSAPQVRVRGRRPAPLSEMACAQIVVGAGVGLTTEGVALLPQVSTALGGAYAYSSSLADREKAGAERRIGLEGAGASAELYLAVGASGSERHLAGLGPRTVIAAVNTDPGAPIFERASYALGADATEALRAILHELCGDS